MRSVKHALAVLTGVGMLTCGASAAVSVNWPFDLTTTGNNVFFTSSTATDPAAPQYETTFEVTQVAVIVRWLFIDIGPVDVTDQIPPEQLMGTELIDGPAPVSVSNVSFEYPPPPEPLGFAGTIDISIDAAGVGHGALTDVTLGTLQFDVGGGNFQTVTLKSVRVVGSVTVLPVYTAGDIDENGVVNVFDLFELLSAWGNCPKPCPPSCTGDLNDDCIVNVFDLFIMLGNWG